MSLKKSTSVLIISLATTASRILGLIRDQVFAYILGAGDFSDAFFVAFRIPNLLRDLFAEGSLSTAFIPTFTHCLVKKGKKEAFKLANYTINFIFLFLCLLIILSYFFTPQIINLYAHGYANNAVKLNLVILLTKILMPFLIFISMAAIFMGMLNTHHKFFIPAIASALFNVVVILFGVIILIFHSNDLNKAILWSIGTLLGGLFQFLIQIPAAKKIGYSYQPILDWKFKNQGLRQILKLMLPAIIGVAAIQINFFINTRLATALQTGAVSFLQYSFRLIYLPIGIFGVAIATVTTAIISRDIAQKDYTSLKNNISFALKLNSFLSIPSTVALMVLGIPIIRLLFQHGKFNQAATLYTYYALLFSAPVLFFYSGIKIFAPIFYAMKKSFIPVISSAIAVAVNIIISVSTYRTLDVRGLSLGLTCSAFVNFLFLFIMFTYYHGFIVKSKIIPTIFKHVLCSILMGIIGFYFYQYFKNSIWILACLGSLIVSGLIYLFTCYIFKVNELHEFLEIFANKFKPKKSS